MKPAAAALLCLACGCAAPALAQRPVPITSEPHHHLVYGDARLRVFRVEVPAHSGTLVHEHPVDYFWIAVGPADIVNAVTGKDEAHVVAPDGSVHFTRGGFAHLARVEGAQAFRNVTIELPQTQTNQRNLCEAALADQPLDCAAATQRAAGQFPGADAKPEFETDQIRVTLITVAPAAKLAIARRAHPMVLVSVDDAAGELPITCVVAGRPRNTPLQSRSGNSYPLTSRGPCTVENGTGATVRFLALEMTATAR
jgi:hypothetical protein